jgi:3-deoxy-D-arabino-heptulosonate 7-phosphate (DAHP) synthase
MTLKRFYQKIAKSMQVGANVVQNFNHLKNNSNSLRTVFYLKYLMSTCPKLQTSYILILHICFCLC